MIEIAVTKEGAMMALRPMRNARGEYLVSPRQPP
jgi:hypothetical protein